MVVMRSTWFGRVTQGSPDRQNVDEKESSVLSS